MSIAHRFGSYGGQYVPETLMPALAELEAAWELAWADPEFRSAFAAYIEWGTRIALANSQPGATPPPQAPVPRWGWGEAPPFTG